jgi:hypothetical protein
VCRTRARVLGYEPEIVPCQDDLILLVNKEKEKVAALGMHLDTDGNVKFESFMIDVRKWMWVEAEGFSMEEMTESGSNLKKSIFLSAAFDDLPKLLL